MNDLPDTPEGMLRLMQTRSVEASPFAKFLGIEIVRCWDGEAELVMPVRPDLTQHRGTVHGGVLGSLADNVCGYAIASRTGPVVTAGYTIHLLAPVQGDKVRAVGRVVRAGKRQAVAASDLYVEHGGSTTHVATALATMMLVSS